MDLRNLTLLAIKLLGLFFFAEAVSVFAMNMQAFLFLTNDGRLFKEIFLPFILLMPALVYAIIGAILFRASGKIANCVICTGEAEPPSLTAHRLLSVAIRMVCLYFVLKTFYSLILHWSEVYLFYVGTRPMDLPKDKAILLANGVQFAAALAGWFYAEKIVEITKKFSKDE